MTQKPGLKTRFSERFASPSSNLRYPPVRMPFDVLIEDGAIGVRIPKEDLQLLLACAKWELPLPFVSAGRGALAKRLMPLRFKDRSIGSYKLKGCGAHQEDMVIPPNPTQFSGQPGILIHMGFDPDGTLKPIPDPPKPLGGLGKGRGKREFDNAVRLFKAEVPAVIPICWGSYKTLQFQGENMEFVILGIDEGIEARVGELFESGIGENHEINLNPALIALMDSKVDYYSLSARGKVALMCVCEIARLFGETLYQFHSKGKSVRFAGHSGNYSFDKKKNRVILHDLDSCVSIDEIEPAIIGLSKVRDLESALFGLLHSYLHSRLSKLVTPSDRKKYNPFRAFFEGYFKGDKKAQNGIAEAGDKMQDLFDQEALKLDCVSNALQMMRWFQDLFITFVPQGMRAAMPLYESSEQATEHPLLYGLEKFESYFAYFRVEQRRVYERICRERGLSPV